MRASNAVCFVVALRVPLSSSQSQPPHTQSVLNSNAEAAANGEAALNEALRSHPEIVDEYFPNKEAVEVYQRYEERFPPTEDFVIGLLVNPCGANGTHGRVEEDVALGYDCCSERFGQGEYAFRPGTRNRFSNGYSNGIPVSPDEPLHNIELVDEFGNELDHRYSRRADDILLIDEACVGLRDPHMACIADRFVAARSKIMPPCWDNNQTVDVTLDCHTHEGKRRPHCMQVSYSQNAYIYVCGGDFANDDRCGTYLEIHKANGSASDDEATILSDVKITTPMTNGMQTTTIPLVYKGDKDRILCSYDEVHIRAGSMVRVKRDAPSCCCPPRTSRNGAFFCPKRQWSKDGGPFAPALKSLEEQYADDYFQQSFPRCPPLDADDEDGLMCTQERAFADEIPTSDPGRYFVRPCMPLVEAEDDGSYSSADLLGMYSNSCPFFEACGLRGGECHEKDYSFTFEAEIGKVVHVPDDPDGNYSVSFNDGRSAYWFARSELELLKPEGTYQLWFVQRIRGQKKIVQKKKPFRVIWPRCTFDSVNGRYFPFAQLDVDGKPIA